jgi:RNA polymerase sigma factor (TIGR02999 family)
VIARPKRTSFPKILPLLRQKGDNQLVVTVAPIEEVTQILQMWSDGDPHAPAKLMPLVYEELRRRAAEYLRRERPDHTLQATALVHEAYLKLVDQSRSNWRDRAHFASVASHLMRRILVQHARTHNAEKRGGKLEKLYLDETRELSHERPPDIVALDEALQNFAKTYPREATVVELKFFGGLEASEIGEVLDVSSKTVLRDWNFAKLWLRRELTENPAHA